MIYPQCHTIILDPKSPYFLEEENQHIPLFEYDHFYLLELSNIFEPKMQYSESLDFTFSSIDNKLSSYEQWEEFSDGPIPGTAQINCTPEN